MHVIRKEKKSSLQNKVGVCVEMALPKILPLMAFLSLDKKFPYIRVLQDLCVIRFKNKQKGYME